MPSKRYNTEGIIHKLREADVLLSQGSNTGEVCKQLGVSEQTYYRWRKLYGGMKVAQAKRLKALDAEPLPKCVDKQSLKEVAEGNY